MRRGWHWPLGGEGGGRGGGRRGRGEGERGEGGEERAAALQQEMRLSVKGLALALRR